MHVFPFDSDDFNKRPALRAFEKNEGTGSFIVEFGPDLMFFYISCFIFYRFEATVSLEVFVVKRRALVLSD